jgi:hypothetical protein
MSFLTISASDISSTSIDARPVASTAGERMTLIDRIGGAAGIGTAIYFFFRPGCICDLWLDESRAAYDIAPETPSAEIARAFAANTESTRTHAYIGLIAVLLLLVFFSRLHGALRDAAGPSSWLPTAALAGGVLLAGVLTFDVGLGFAASELTDYGNETEVLRFFPLWGWYSATLWSPPFALALFGTTFVAWSTRAFPPWYRWLSTVLFVLLLLIAGVGLPGLAIAPGILWMFATALLLTLRQIAPVNEHASKVPTA